MRDGHFSADATEFVITRPETPQPWRNHLVNDRYAAVLSQGGGSDRHLFFKEGARVWSATYQPLRVRPDAFHARHGLGYTIIRSTYAGVAAEVIAFVPTADACEVWLVTLTNRTRRTRRLDVFPYVAWGRGDETEEAWLRHRAWLDRPLAAVFAQQTAVRRGQAWQPVSGVSFLAGSLALEGCVTRRAAFLGRDNTTAHPAMLYDTPFRSVPLCTGEAAAGVLRHVLTLPPRACVTFTVIVGRAPTRSQVRGLIEKYRRVPEAQAELARVQALWRQRIPGTITIETPDRDVNRLLNLWAKYQLYVCHLRGRGYRGACQDAEALAALQPQQARQQLLRLASRIRRDGTCASDEPEAGIPNHSSHMDDPLWLTFAVAAYVQETGDGALLHEWVPYLAEAQEPREGAAAAEEGTLCEHLEANLAWIFHHVGPHGLPLIGGGDCHASLDAAGRQGRGESVWLAVALVRALKRLAEAVACAGLAAAAQTVRAHAEVMTRRINETAWDGQWYVAGFTDEGAPFGSAQSTEGRMYLAPQAWALLAGVPDEHRQQALLQAIDRHVRRECGYLACAPPYTAGQPSLGRISFDAAGMGENGAIVGRTAADMMRADCQAGRGNQAYRTLRALLPNAQPDACRYQLEPYVFARSLIGPAHPYRAGEGRGSWMNGVAGAVLLTTVAWLLGVRPVYTGLEIDPCLPSRWRRCRLVRAFRGAVYDITLLNPRRVQRGVAGITVDGQTLEGTVVPPHGDGRVHRIVVTMGPVTPVHAAQHRSYPAVSS